MHEPLVTSRTIQSCPSLGNPRRLTSACGRYPARHLNFVFSAFRTSKGVPSFHPPFRSAAGRFAGVGAIPRLSASRYGVWYGATFVVDAAPAVSRARSAAFASSKTDASSLTSTGRFVRRARQVLL
jgi:hypothetical protein